MTFLNKVKILFIKKNPLHNNVGLLVVFFFLLLYTCYILYNILQCPENDREVPRQDGGGGRYFLILNLYLKSINYTVSSDLLFSFYPCHDKMISFSSEPWWLTWTFSKRLTTKFVVSINLSTQLTMQVSVLLSSFCPARSTHVSQHWSVSVWTSCWKRCFCVSASKNRWILWSLRASDILGDWIMASRKKNQQIFDFFLTSNGAKSRCSFDSGSDHNIYWGRPLVATRDITLTNTLSSDCSTLYL